MFWMVWKAFWMPGSPSGVTFLTLNRLLLRLSLDWKLMTSEKLSIGALIRAALCGVGSTFVYYEMKISLCFYSFVPRRPNTPRRPSQRTHRFVWCLGCWLRLISGLFAGASWSRGAWMSVNSSRNRSPGTDTGDCASVATRCGYDTCRKPDSLTCQSYWIWVNSSRNRSHGTGTGD